MAFKWLKMLLPLEGDVWALRVTRRRYVWALRVNVSDPSSWVTVFGPFECHVKPYANIVQKGKLFSMNNIVHEIPYGKIVHEKPCENIAHEKPYGNIAHEKTYTALIISS